MRPGDKGYGTVKWFNASKGYGFITTAKGADVFVHQTNIISEGYRTLDADDKVEFIAEISKSSGKIEATQVRKVDE